jgi:CRP/FNR family transcriptional regulator, cyclic AMP receptor protein
MSAFLDLVRNHPIERFQAGDILIEQNHDTGRMLVLLEGEVEVLRDDVRVGKAAEPGACFGEMSALLHRTHTATVRATTPCTVAVIERPREFLASSPAAALHIAELLARRLDALNKYLIDVKNQYEGHDHLSMVDQVLETLMHRQPRASAR